MILYLFIWFAFSVIVSIILAQIIGKVPNTNLEDEDLYKNSDWYI